MFRGSGTFCDSRTGSIRASEPTRTELDEKVTLRTRFDIRCRIPPPRKSKLLVPEFSLTLRAPSIIMCNKMIHRLRKRVSLMIRSTIRTILTLVVLTPSAYAAELVYTFSQSTATTTWNVSTTGVNYFDTSLGELNSVKSRSKRLSSAQVQ